MHSTDIHAVEIDEKFLAAVYKVTADIPRGKVATYGQVGRMAGYPKAGREVGIAMSQAPRAKNLPCHRVVNKIGTLSPDHVFGGKEKQRRMLEAEGITFTEDGVIRMEKHTWGEYEQLSLF